MISNTRLIGTKVGFNAFFFQLAGPVYVKPPAREFTVDIAATYKPSTGGMPPPVRQFVTGPVQKATGAEIYPPTAASPTPTQPGIGEPDAQGLPPQDVYIPDQPAAPVQVGEGQRDPDVVVPNNPQQQAE